MRVRLRVYSGIIAIAIAATCGLGLHAKSQDSSNSEKLLEEPMTLLDDTKLMVQRFALPSLEGEEPFTLRETTWTKTIKPGEAHLIQIQLFRRNEYQFWMAAPDLDAEVILTAYNSNGEMIESEVVTYEQSNVVSIIVKPENTGIYFIRASLKTTIDRPQRWVAIYGYR